MMMDWEMDRARDRQRLNNELQLKEQIHKEKMERDKRFRQENFRGLSPK
jgi:hypothetical protein